MEAGKIKKYLIISLLINAFLIGIIVSGAILKKDNSFKNRMDIEKYVSKKRLRQTKQNMEEAKDKIKEALKKEPFDETLVRKAFEEELERMLSIQKEIHNKIKEKIIRDARSLPPHERANLIMEYNRRPRRMNKKFGNGKKHFE